MSDEVWMRGFFEVKDVGGHDAGGLMYTMVLCWLGDYNGMWQSNHEYLSLQVAIRRSMCKCACGRSHGGRQTC